MNPSTASQLAPLQDLANHLGLARDSAEIELIGADPILASPHRLSEATAIALLLEAAAAASLWNMRTGHGGVKLSTDVTQAIHSLHSTHFIQHGGYPVSVGAEYIPTNGLFRCRDGRFIMTHSGPPYVKLERGFLNYFDCGNNRDSFSREVAKCDSFELQEKLSQLGLPACIAFSPQEWRSHPHGQALSAVPVIEIEKLSDGEPIPFEDNCSYPLDGIKALDFTHVLAGPRSMRSLASYGAQVLHISSPYHRDTISQNILVNLGKRSAYLQLTEERNRALMSALLSDADVFAFSYRPSVAERFDLTPQAVAEKHRGIVCLSVNCYGYSGPWKDRAGFDQNAQAATGFAVSEGGAGHPRFSPVFYLNDLLTAYLAAAGVMSALARRATEGGSYHVKLSLARTAMWVQDLGYISQDQFASLPSEDKYPAAMRTVTTDLGEITELASAITAEGLPRIDLSLLRGFGADKPRWD